MANIKKLLKYILFIWSILLFIIVLDSCESAIHLNPFMAIDHRTALIIECNKLRDWLQLEVVEKENFADISFFENQKLEFQLLQSVFHDTLYCRTIIVQ